ncbi:hypothetical protein QCA50_001413 [Cerrena zonata]|uniref:Uncharacterized protein n=1 Tax=Cerrena zonata TaxID=2478898 RepID=A0AAW0GUV1_9APHY
MKGLRQQGARIHAHSGVLTDISNGIVQDSRVFHLEDRNFLDMYNKQVMFEMQRTGAMAEGGTDYITSNILERQQKDGWDAARESLATTVRGYAMRGFLSGKLQADNHVAEEEFLKRALEVLEWGHTGPWKDVPETTKGVIFSKTFMRGVRVLHMEAYMGAYLEDPQTYPLQALYDEARALIHECEEAAHELTSDKFVPGFTNSFYMYPTGHAIAMVGFYHVQKATGNGEGDPGVTTNHYREAGMAYLEAARMFLPDDELHVWYLHVGLTNMCKSGTPIKDLLPIMEKIKLAIPKMKRIWEYSAMAKERDPVLDRIVTVYDSLREGIANGTHSADDKIVPAWEI